MRTQSKRLIIIALSLLALSPANAALCADVNLSGVFGPLFLETQRDQALDNVDSNICYAVVAAQLFDAHRRTQGIVLDRTSAVASALSYLEHYDVQTIEGGQTNQALTAMMMSGACSTLQLQEDRFGIVGTLKKFGFLSAPPQDPVEMCRNSKKQQDFEKCQSRYLQKNYDDFIAKKAVALERLSQQCPASERMFLKDSAPRSRGIGTQNRDEAIARIIELLQHRRAVGIDVKISGLIGVDANHAMMIIGSRNVNNKCQFLVRNSYGAKCNRFMGAFECHRGDYWIESQTLINTSVKYHWIQNSDESFDF